MTASQPPRLATWLLERWGSGPNRQSLAGDLIERYQHGRSRAWYWRQVLRAIVAGLFCEMGSHKLLGLRALVVGWIALALLARAEWYAIAFAFGVPVDTPVAVSGRVMFLIGCICTGLSGWIVARVHRPYAISMSILYAISFAIFSSIELVESVVARQAVQTPPHWLLVYFLATALFNVMLAVLSIVLGGLLGAVRLRSRIASVGETA